jgi:hypothetical protein
VGARRGDHRHAHQGDHKWPHDKWQNDSMTSSNTTV